MKWVRGGIWVPFEGAAYLYPDFPRELWDAMPPVVASALSELAEPMRMGLMPPLDRFGLAHYDPLAGRVLDGLVEFVDRFGLWGLYMPLGPSSAALAEQKGLELWARTGGGGLPRYYGELASLLARYGPLGPVSGKASDEGYQSIAKLRLAGILLETKAYDEALKSVSGSFPKDFTALASDRRGDILLAQGKKNEAKTEYEKAYKGLDERAEYRRLVEVKLNALGIDPAATTIASPSSSPVTPAADSEAKK